MVRINTVFPQDILKEIDRIAKEKGKSRSRLLRDAAQSYIKQYQIQKAEEMKRKKIKTSMGKKEKGGRWF